jgi:hypothetical protein
VLQGSFVGSSMLVVHIAMSHPIDAVIPIYLKSMAEIYTFWFEGFKKGCIYEFHLASIKDTELNVVFNETSKCLQKARSDGR